MRTLSAVTTTYIELCTNNSELGTPLYTGQPAGFQWYCSYACFLLYEYATVSQFPKSALYIILLAAAVYIIGLLLPRPAAVHFIFISEVYCDSRGVVSLIC